jgi:uncharacterized protein YdeI (YjbR/CyaY-like superfamily)
MSDMGSAKKTKAAKPVKPAKGALDSLPRFHAKDRAAWRAWLEKNHATSPGVWLVTDKKAPGAATKRLDAVAVNEEALCFGWIDSLPRALDEAQSMMLCTPRKPKSKWSQVNKERVARLTAEGKMAPAGLAMVELAKKTGTWDALAEVEALVVPPDLARALAALPPARDHFEAFPRSVKRAILEWIASAKKEETRAKRVEETATLAQKNVRANQWRQ